MALTSGTRVGPYDILAPLGAGGMGEVYRARDGKLHRDVALKILPPAFSADPDRLGRFRREAQVLASLNHPNIGHIYGFEDDGSMRALVLELVEGPTLADRLAQGPLAVSDALPIAKQIADALEAAHEQGITHRDLKPANIKIRDDGTVKVLDFGLAKAMDPSWASNADAMNSPTFTAHATEIGVILGTAAYMSPEQARGKAVDKRTDIWAFGVVLFEMLTGHRLFDGETVSDTIAKLLERDPDWSALPPQLPPKVRELLRRCLEKDPRKRQRDIGDVRIELDEALARVPGATTAALAPPAATARHRPSPRAMALWAALLLVGAIAGIALWQTLGPGAGAPRSSPSGPLRLSVGFPTSVRVEDVTITRDGQTMIVRGFPRNPDGSEAPRPRLYSRSLDKYGLEPLPGTDGVGALTLSPDALSIAFVGTVSDQSSQRRLSRVRIDGSAPPVVLSDWDEAWTDSIAWLEDGDVLILSNNGTKFFRLPSGGGAPKPAMAVDTGSVMGNPALGLPLPGDRGVFFSMESWDSRGFQLDLWLLDPKTGKARRLFERAGNAVYAPTGHVLFTRGETLMAAPFDLDKMSVAGDVVPLLAGIRTRNSWAHGTFASRDGRLVYTPGGRVGTDRQLVVVDEKGNVTPFASDRRAFELPPIASRDGRQVAAVIPNEQGTYQTWVADEGRPGLRRVLALPGADASGPMWSPDGQRLAFSRMARDKDDGIYVQRADGAGSPTALLKAESLEIGLRLGSWAPDGSGLLVIRSTGGKGDLLFLPTTSAGAPGKPRVLRATPYSEANARFSPDGRLVAFDSDDTGRREIFVATFGKDGTLGPPVAASIGGGTHPVWTPDGKRIFYDNAPNRMMAASIQTTPTLSASAPVVVHDLRTLRVSPTEWDALPDGRLIAIQRGQGEDDITQVNIVLNWFDELRTRMTNSASSPAGR